jgi:hypothetical protein
LLKEEIRKKIGINRIWKRLCLVTLLLKKKKPEKKEYLRIQRGGTPLCYKKQDIGYR